MSNKLKILGAIVLCLGIVGTGILAFNLGYDYIGIYTKQLNIGRFLGILAGGIVATAVSSCLLFGFAEVLDKMDEIIYWQKNKKD